MEYISSSRRLALNDVVDRDLESEQEVSAEDSESYDEYEEVYVDWEDEVSLCAYEAAVSRHLFSPPSNDNQKTSNSHSFAEYNHTIYGYFHKPRLYEELKPKIDFDTIDEEEDNMRTLERVKLLRIEKQQQDKISSERNNRFSEAASFSSKKGPKWFTIHVFLLLQGVVIGIVSFTMYLLIMSLQTGHHYFYDLSSNSFVRYLLWNIWIFFFAFFATIFTEYVQPLGMGTGIPQLTTILSGTKIKGFFDIQTLLAQVVGICAIKSSGIICGDEGPIVLISASISHQLMRARWFKKIWKTPGMKHMIYSAAASSGFACAFGSSPVGGILMCVELLQSFFPTRLLWYCFLAAVTASTLWTVLINSYFETSIFQSKYHSNISTQPAGIVDFLGVLILGAICGLLGYLFTFCNCKLIIIRRWINEKIGKIVVSHVQTHIYVATVCFLTGLLTFPDFSLSSSLYNHDAFREIISSDSLDSGVWIMGHSVFGGLLVFFVFRFWLQILSLSFPAPVGLFSPLMTLGACLGRLVGEMMNRSFPGSVLPAGTYAIFGAAALPGSSFQALSAAVVVMELTGLSNSFLLLVVTTMISYFISRALSPSIFQSLIVMQNLPWLPHLAFSRFGIQAKDFMGRNVAALNCNASLEDVLSVLRKHKKNCIQDGSGKYMIPIVEMRQIFFQNIMNQEYPPDETTELMSPTDRHTDYSSNAKPGKKVKDPEKVKAPFLVGCVKYQFLQQEATWWEERLYEQTKYKGIRFSQLSKIRIDIRDLLGKAVCLPNVVFNTSVPISIIQNSFINWNLSNAFVQKNGILKGMITRPWLSSALSSSQKELSIEM